MRLIREAVLTAKAAGIVFCEEEITNKVRQVSLNNLRGCTLIRADLRDGRRTEADAISGAVVRAAAKCGAAEGTSDRPDSGACGHKMRKKRGFP